MQQSGSTLMYNLSKWVTSQYNHVVEFSFLKNYYCYYYWIIVLVGGFNSYSIKVKCVN